MRSEMAARTVFHESINGWLLVTGHLRTDRLNARHPWMLVGLLRSIQTSRWLIVIQTKKERMLELIGDAFR